MSFLATGAPRPRGDARGRHHWTELRPETPREEPTGWPCTPHQRKAIQEGRQRKAYICTAAKSKDISMFSQLTHVHGALFSASRLPVFALPGRRVAALEIVLLIFFGVG